MGEYIPVYYRRVSYLSYDLAYDRYYTESQRLSAADLLARQGNKSVKLEFSFFFSLNKSFKTKAKSELDLDDKGYIQRSKLPDYFTEKKEASEVKVHDKMIEEKKNKY